MTLKADLDDLRAKYPDLTDDGIDRRYEAAYDDDAEVMVYDATGTPRTGWVRLAGTREPVLVLVGSPARLSSSVILDADTTLLGIRDGVVFVPTGASGPLPTPVPEPDSYFD